MKNKPLYFAISLSILALCSCSQVATPYNSLARSEHLNLENDGFILSFEKRSKKKMRISGASYQSVITQPAAHKEDRRYSNYFNKTITSDPKALVATHIIQKKADQKSFLYNAYNAHPSSSGDHISETNTLAKLQLFKSELRSSLRENRYTHIMVMSMGWNNDQHVSIYNYNRIIKNIQHSAGGHRFKPLVIGVTWPSVWGSRKETSFIRTGAHLISYFNKSDDADELGISYLNWLLHDAIPYSQGDRRVPVVAIGHSFGARAMSRAVYSRSYLISPQQETEPVDLFVGLQSATSIYRHLPGKNFLRGAPYSQVRFKKTKIVYTTSKNDKSNGAARFITQARLIGGPHALKIAEKQKDSPYIDFHRINEGCKLDIDIPKGRPLIVDASLFVKGVRKEDTGIPYSDLSPHNDILDLDMGEFIWSCINQL